MKSSMKDKTEGAFHQAKGTLKEATGKLVNNKELEVEGVVEKIAGKAQEKFGEIKSTLGK